MQCLNQALSLEAASRMTNFNRLECFICPSKVMLRSSGEMDARNNPNSKLVCLWNAKTIETVNEGQSHKFVWLLYRYEPPYPFTTELQSYKQLTLVIYESSVVIFGILKSGTTLES